MENDEEYVALVSNHLSKEIMWDWFKQRKSGWSNFYLFLEDVTQTAKMQLTSESIRFALSGDQGDKTKCSSFKNITQGSVTNQRMLQLLIKVERIPVQFVTNLFTNINKDWS